MSSDSAEDQSKYAADHSFQNSGLYDPNQFNYGGSPDAASHDATAYENAGNTAQQRQAALADYSGANSYAHAGINDASDQRNAAGLIMARANGSAPLVSQMQADRQMQQNNAMQASQAASARGAAGLALAGQTASTNIANGSAAISAQAQMSGAQEQLANAQAANQAYAGLRSGDLASQQQAAQQAQYQSGLVAQQRSQNDQFQLAQQQNAINVRNSQLQAGIAQQNMLSGNNQATVNAQMAIQQQNAANQRAAVGGAIQGVANAATAGVTSGAFKSSSAPLSSDAQGGSVTNGGVYSPGGAMQNQGYAAPRAEGGLINAGRPYLVGERGPELVVPDHSGLVVPAGPTAQMTGDASGLMAAAQDPKKAAVLRAAQQNPQIGMHLRQQAMNDPAVAAKVQADPALMAIAMGKV